MYVLDPLESLSTQTPIGGAASSSSERRTQQNGVAVGLGLMSWARVSEESKSLQIAGTLINNGRAALEVVFALREVRELTSTFSPNCHVKYPRRHLLLTSKRVLHHLLKPRR